MLKESLDFLRFQSKQNRLNTLKQETLYNQNHDNMALTSTTSLATIDILDFLRKNNNSDFIMPTNPAISKSSKLLNYNSVVSILPSGDLLDRVGSFLELAFGKKFWIYCLFFSFVFGFLFCICCICCSKCGRKCLCYFALPNCCKKRKVIN
jgi:hypothetical protein